MSTCAVLKNAASCISHAWPSSNSKSKRCGASWRNFIKAHRLFRGAGCCNPGGAGLTVATVLFKQSPPPGIGIKTEPRTSPMVRRLPDARCPLLAGSRRC